MTNIALECYRVTRSIITDISSRYTREAACAYHSSRVSEADLQGSVIQFIDLAKTGRHQWWTFLLGLSIVVISTAIGSVFGKLLLRAWADGHSCSDPIHWLIADRSFEKIGCCSLFFW